MFRFSAFAMGLLLVVPWLGHSVMADEAERFENPTAGISLLKPIGWNTASIQDVEKNRERIRLPEGTGRPRGRQEIHWVDQPQMFQARQIVRSPS